MLSGPATLSESAWERAKRDQAEVAAAKHYNTTWAIVLLAMAAVGFVIDEFSTQRSLQFRVAVFVLCGIVGVVGPYIAVLLVKWKTAARRQRNEARAAWANSQEQLAEAIRAREMDRRERESELHRADQAFTRGVLLRLLVKFDDLQQAIDQSKIGANDWAWHVWNPLTGQPLHDPTQELIHLSGVPGMEDVYRTAKAPEWLLPQLYALARSRIQPEIQMQTDRSPRQILDELDEKIREARTALEEARARTALA